MTDAVSGLAIRLGVNERLLRGVLRVECGTDRLPPPGTRPTIRVEAHHVLRHVEAGRGRRIPGPDVGMRVRDLATGTCWGGERGRELRGSWADVPHRPHDRVRHEIEYDGAWVPYHGDQALEWDALAVADLVVGPELATACTSWGMTQILGTTRVGLTWEQIRAEAAVDGGLGLLEPYLHNVLPAALEALKRGDLLAFARAYNGTGQPEWYADHIRKAAA